MGESKSPTEEARDLALRAIELSPNFSEAHYHVAKYSALLGHSDRSIKSLEKAIAIDRNYAVKVDDDPAFASVQRQVVSFLQRLRATAEAEAKKKIEIAEKELKETEQWRPESVGAFQDTQNQLGQARSYYKSGTYFDYLDAIPIAAKAADLAIKVRSDRIEYLRHTVTSYCNIGVNEHDKKHLRTEYCQPIDDTIEEIRKLSKQAVGRLGQTPESLFEAVDIAENAKAKSDTLRGLLLEEGKFLQKEEERARKKFRLAEKRNKHILAWTKAGAWIGGICGPIAGCAYGCANVLGKSEGEAFGLLIGGPLLGVFVGAAGGSLICACLGLIFSYLFIQDGDAG